LLGEYLVSLLLPNPNILGFLVPRLAARLSSSHNSFSALSMSTRPPAINPDGTLVKFPPPSPSSPASRAAVTGDVDALAALSVDALLSPDDGSDNTPLIFAADEGRLDAVNHIVARAVAETYVNARGYVGNTAVSRAARGGHVEVVKSLLSAGADPNIPNDKEQYPLHFAAFKRRPECVRALLESGKCDLNVTDRKGRLPEEDTSDESIKAMIRASK